MRIPKLSFVLFKKMSIMLVGFSLLVFLIFTIFINVTLAQMVQRQLSDRALQIASAIPSVSGHRHNISSMPMYLRFLYESTSDQVSIVDSNLRVESYQDSALTSFDQFPTFIQQQIMDVLNNKDVQTSWENRLFSSTFYGIAPIENERGKISGVLVLQTPSDAFTFVNAPIYVAMLLSLLVGLFFVYVLAKKQSKSLVKPINGLIEYVQNITNDQQVTNKHLANNQEMKILEENLLVLADRLEQAKNQRNELDKQQKQFIASISHELKTPLTIIQGYIEAMNDNVLDQHDTDEVFGLIAKQTNLLQTLIDDLFEITRLDHVDFTLNKQEVNVKVILDEVVHNYQSIAKKKSVTLYSDSNKDIFSMADEKRLTQMFSIFIDNAIKFSKENQTVSIIQDQQDATLFMIKDQGKGISDEDKEKVFLSFYKTNLNNPDGTGLGLTIAKKIAKLHQIELKLVDNIPHGLIIMVHFTQ